MEVVRRGCDVTALDASHAAIAHIQAVAEQEALSLHATKGGAQQL